MSEKQNKIEINQQPSSPSVQAGSLDARTVAINMLYMNCRRCGVTMERGTQCRNCGAWCR